MTSSHTAAAARTAGRRFGARDRRTRNGSAKCPKIRASPTHPHPWFSLATNQCVSPGMFAYHWSISCENAMYAQNTTNPNSSFPRSW